VRREPLLLPAAALAGGILLAHFFYFQLLDLLIPSGLAVLVLTLTLLCKGCVRFRTISVFLCFVLAGIATQTSHRPAHTPTLNATDGETVLLSGCVTNPPVFSPEREQFTLRLTPNAAARITLNLKNSDSLTLRYGQQVEVEAKIRSPRNFQNPDAFDYAGFLAAQHIYWNGSISASSQVSVLPGSCGSPLVAGLFAVRSWALVRLTDLYPGDQHTAGLLQATLLGETSGIEKRWTSDFRVTGTYHALVISGQHVSVLAFSLLLLLRLFRMRRVPALCVATVACWLYAFISGLSSPVVRAAGGFTLFLIASYCFRRTRILNILAAVGVIYLLFDPDQLFDPSFQLSFLSAAAIAAFAIPLMENSTEPMRAAVKRLDQRQFDPNVAPNAAVWRVEFRLLAETISLHTPLSFEKAQAAIARATQFLVFVGETIIVSACVQFGLALPMISYFHRLSVTGLTANIIVIPLLSLVIPLGFASILTGFKWLSWITKMLLLCSEWVAAWHVHFEPAWRLAAIPLAFSIAFSASLILLAFCLRRRQKLAALAFTLSFAIFAVLLYQPWQPLVQRGKLELTAIDVSQGDSLFMAFPDGETMLIDAGGFPGMERMKRKPQLDIGEDVVSPYLWSRRIQRLDYAVLTHGHSDHMAGLAAILDNFHPKVLWVGVEPDSAEWRIVKQHAQADGVKIVSLTRASAPRRIGGASIRILSPAPDYLPEETAKNDDSLVLEVSYGRRSILLTGDAEQPVEADLVASGLLHPVTLLKVGHHGSKTSSSEEFINQIQPKFAFISDGYMNQFHHPHPSVLERLAQHHIGVFRTDVQGLSTFLTDGDKVEFSTFRQGGIGR
jgi:competence protein ComEC